MSQALVGLNQIAGVLGSAIFNAKDECLVHMMPAPFDATLLGQLMVEVRNGLNVLDYLDDSSSWTAIVVRFDRGYLVVRSLHNVTIMVLADASLNPAMLSVGFNVASLKLDKEGVPQPAAASRAPTAPAHAHPHPHVPAPANFAPAARATTAPAHPVPLAAPPSVASSSTSVSHNGPLPATPVSQSSPGVSQSSPGLSQSSRTPLPPGPSSLTQSSQRLSSVSGLGSSQGGHDAAPVPDAVGRPIIDALLKALAKHIGPFAKLIMKEELTKLGVTAATLGFSQYEDFVGLLGRRLQDPVKRREFMTEAESLPHANTSTPRR